jgi:hypothetical protein
MRLYHVFKIQEFTANAAKRALLILNTLYYILVVLNSLYSTLLYFSVCVILSSYLCGLLEGKQFESMIREESEVRISAKSTLLSEYLQISYKKEISRMI